MDPFQRTHLRIVPSDDVHAHEVADPYREGRIEGRLRADGVLRDPLMVGAVPDVAGYVLLDGTNRQRALVSLGLPWALVQIVDYADPHAVELRTWCHAVAAPLDDVLDLATRPAGLAADLLSPLEASGSLRAPDTFAVLLGKERQYLVTRTPEPGSVSRAQHSRFEQLHEFVLAYEARMHRVDCDADEIEQRIQTLDRGGEHPTTLVAFPPFTRSQVVTIALRGTLIPAGITRHVIQVGRALRVNLPLHILSGEGDLDEGNALLDQHLSTLHPRSYAEPTILFDS